VLMEKQGGRKEAQGALAEGGAGGGVGGGGGGGGGGGVGGGGWEGGGGGGGPTSTRCATRPKLQVMLGDVLRPPRARRDETRFSPVLGPPFGGTQGQRPGGAEALAGGCTREKEDWGRTPRSSSNKAAQGTYVGAELTRLGQRGAHEAGPDVRTKKGRTGTEGPRSPSAAGWVWGDRRGRVRGRPTSLLGKILRGRDRRDLTSSGAQPRCKSTLQVDPGAGAGRPKEAPPPECSEPRGWGSSSIRTQGSAGGRILLFRADPRSSLPRPRTTPPTTRAGGTGRRNAWIAQLDPEELGEEAAGR